jgi:RNA-directed DNA polymerase
VEKAKPFSMSKREVWEAYKSALYPTFQHLDRLLVRWAMRKYKRLRGHQRRAAHWLRRIARGQPNLFAHWGFWQAAAGR